MTRVGRYAAVLICLFSLFAVAYSAQSGKTVVQPVTSGTVAPPRPEPGRATAADDVIPSPPATRPETVENVRQCAELKWAFGGKPQRGVELYVPLVCRLIGLEGDEAGGVEQGGFADALARWQRAAGLTPRGVLDEETWARMITTWQGRRQRERAVAASEQLVLVAADEFYDPERPAELRYVERETYAAYRRMIAAAAADPALGLKTTAAGELAADEKFLKIISAFRSPEYQARLRKLEPGAGRAALAVHSPHFTGRALDLYVGGEPVITKDANRALQTSTKAYRWLVRYAEEFGFYPYFYEPWHWEYKPPQSHD
jgi:zinc D-Ala-D-Ala carboxypeptidase